MRAPGDTVYHLYLLNCHRDVLPSPLIAGRENGTTTTSRRRKMVVVFFLLEREQQGIGVGATFSLGLPQNTHSQPTAARLEHSQHSRSLSLSWQDWRNGERAFQEGDDSVCDVIRFNFFGEHPSLINPTLWPVCSAQDPIPTARDAVNRHSAHSDA